MSPDELHKIFKTLLAFFGPQNWWPARTRLETVVGAVLVQNTAWSNADKALGNLRQAGRLNWLALSSMTPEELAPYIRPSGYYNLKAQRLANLLTLFKKYNPWHSFFKQDLPVARKLLLEVKGIGQETADVLLLYVGRQPVFVVDAYSLRICSRHGWLPPKAGYNDMQAFFMERLSPDVELFVEFHALLVALGKHFCFKSKPLCANCPLFPWLEGSHEA